MGYAQLAFSTRRTDVSDERARGPGDRSFGSSGGHVSGEPDVPGTRPRTGRATGSSSLRSPSRRSPRARSDRIGFGRIIVAVPLGAVLLFAFWTSRVTRRVQRIAVAFVVVTVVAVSVALALGNSRLASVVVGAADAFLTLAALVAILHRLLSHTVISGRTVAGAACAYLLIGIFFMSVFTLLAAAGPGPFYAQTVSERSVDHLYFSFVTLTTVGYGDLTPIPISAG